MYFGLNLHFTRQYGQQQQQVIYELQLSHHRHNHHHRHPQSSSSSVIPLSLTNSMYIWFKKMIFLNFSFYDYMDIFSDIRGYFQMQKMIFVQCPSSQKFFLSRFVLCIIIILSHHLYVFDGVPPEESFAGLAGDGVEVESKRFVTANPANLLLFDPTFPLQHRRT